MSDLHAPGARAVGGTRTRNGMAPSTGLTSSSSAAGPEPGPAGPSASGVRRTLFQSNLTRRLPIGAGAGAGGSASGSRSGSVSASSADAASAHRRALDADRGTTATGAAMATATATQDAPSSVPFPASAADEDIVVRDENGEIALGDLPMPSSAGGGGGGVGGAGDDADDVMMEGAGPGDDDAQRESEKERRRLAEAVRQHQIGQNSVHAQPDELLEAVRTSLRAKVAALSEDNWLFEPEESPRFQ